MKLSFISLVTGCGIYCLLATTPVLSESAEKIFSKQEAITYSQAAVSQQLANYTLTDTNYNSVKTDNLHGKPLLVSLIFTSCYHVCPVITKSLEHAVKQARQVLGTDSFTVLTIGFDTEIDTPDRMSYFAVKQGITDQNWLFLSADAETIRQLTGNLGFIYYPSSRGFDHLAQTTIIDAQGKIIHQVYGQSFEARQIVDPLKKLQIGEITSRPADMSGWLEKIRLFCTVYDPSSGQYQFDYSIIMTLMTGLMCLGVIGLFIVQVWRKNSNG